MYDVCYLKVAEVFDIIPPPIKVYKSLGSPGSVTSE